MGPSSLQLRLDALRRSQNADGGWGYFAGQSSWLEPTVYASLALHGDRAADRAWTLLSSWQMPDGSWRPSAEVAVSTSGTALAVAVAAVREEWGAPFRRGVEWLLGTRGAESRLRNRLLARVGLIDPGRNLALTGWPWIPGTSSWVEPTMQALVALKKASRAVSDARLKERVHLGEAQLLDVRCKDGGWNYGSPVALGVALPSYPETTAQALVGLQGHAGMGDALELAAHHLQETTSPFARAWLRIALRVNGVAPELSDLAAAAVDAASAESSGDVLLTALHALADPRGNARLLKTGAWS